MYLHVKIKIFKPVFSSPASVPSPSGIISFILPAGKPDTLAMSSGKTGKNKLFKRMCVCARTWVHACVFRP